MQRTMCGACSGTTLNVFLDLGQTPLANKFPATADEKETFYPLQLASCWNCGLVQMMELVPDSEIYNEDYGFYSGGSPAQQTYHENGANLLLTRFTEQAAQGVVEVACNDGSLLTHFQEAGCPTLGIDPAPGPVEIARERGLDVYLAPLTTTLAQEIRNEDGPAGLVIAYNSMAHVEDLSDVLTGIRTLMNHDSIAVFEVQYLPDLLAGNMYDQVYHEHRFFYSLTSLAHVCRLHGLFVIDAELIELQGGGLRVTLSADPAVMPKNRVSAIMATERWLGNFHDVQGRIDRTRDHLRSLVMSEFESGRNLAGYAAAAKATTIMNFCGFEVEIIPWIVDTTPYKQGRYLPGLGTPIISPEKAPEVDTLLLLSANYLGYVLRHHPHQGRWIVPQPLPMVI